MARQAELLQHRTMLSSVTFDYGSLDLAIDLDGSDSATAQVTNGQVEVSINGTPTGDMPYTSDIYSITVTAGDGGHTIDLSGLQPVDFTYLPIAIAITTGTGDDDVTGTGMIDIIDVRGGNDQVDGNGGDDNITGGPGEDVLSGGAGWDQIFGGYGDDELWSGSGMPDGGTASLDGGLDTDLIDGELDNSAPDPPPEEDSETPDPPPVEPDMPEDPAVKPTAMADLGLWAVDSINLTKNIASNDNYDTTAPATFTVVNNPGHGTASIDATGKLTYNANDGFAGTDTFTYRITQNGVSSDKAAVTVHVASLRVHYAKPGIFAGASDVTNPEVGAPTPTEVWVGEKVEVFVSAKIPAAFEAAALTFITNPQWTIPGPAVEGYDVTIRTGTVDALTTTDLQNGSVSFFWYDSTTGNVEVAIKADLARSGHRC